MIYRPMATYPYGQGKRHVYLLHFSRPFGHAQHYLGQTDREVAVRVDEHRRGAGAKLTRLAVEAGIELILARVWLDAPRCEEQRIKNRGGLRRACPVCKAMVAQLRQDGVGIIPAIEGEQSPGAPHCSSPSEF